MPFLLEYSILRTIFDNGCRRKDYSKQLKKSVPVDKKDRENNTVQSHFHVLRNRNIMGFIKSTEGEDLEYENQ